MPAKPKPTHCALCSAAFPQHPPGYCGGSGYALIRVKRGWKAICYPCADARQREDLKDRSKPFVAYVAKDAITTWTGGHLMRIIRSVPCRLTRSSFWHSRNSYRSIRAVDVHGGHWHGRGSAGVAIKMRPCTA